MVLGVVLGAVIWLLFEFNKALMLKDFSFKIFIKLNWVPAVTNLICGLVVIWAKDDITDYFVLTRFSSIILGMTGQGLFKKLVSIFDKNIETQIGVNK